MKARKCTCLWISLVFAILVLLLVPSAVALAAPAKGGEPSAAYLGEQSLAYSPRTAYLAGGAGGTSRGLVSRELHGRSAASPGDAPMLPDPIQLVIGAAVTFLVVNGLKDFSNFVGQDLSGWGTVIAAGITAIVVFSINTLLQVAVTIDPSLVPRVNAFLQILVILLGAMGFKRMQR